jgi:hypothetical protein
MRYNIIPAFLLFIFTGLAMGQSVGTQAPDFTHETLEDGTISLSDYRGKVVYLFFFGWN